MIRARASVMIHAARLEFRIRRAHRRERAALACLGEQLATSARRAVRAESEAPLGEIQQVRLQLEAWSNCLAGSLEVDRADYVTVASWMRPLIIVRGLCARAVLRHQVARGRRDLLPLYERLSTAELAEGSGAAGGDQLSPPLVEAVRSARAELASLVEKRTCLLAPFDGRACPAWVSDLAGEGGAFGRALAKQLQGQLLPRVSALAGLAAGWWVTHTYTDSRPRALLRSLGIGSGGTRVVSSETFQNLRFWLPILAAAGCAYLGDRIARWIRQRYEPSVPN